MASRPRVVHIALKPGVVDAPLAKLVEEPSDCIVPGSDGLHIVAETLDLISETFVVLVKTLVVSTKALVIVVEVVIVAPEVRYMSVEACHHRYHLLI